MSSASHIIKMSKKISIKIRACHVSVLAQYGRAKIALKLIVCITASGCSLLPVL
jgi:hypothetical protein